MRGVVFAPMHNTGRKKDASGAFVPEAKRFAKRHDGRLVLIDNRAGKASMREQVLTAIKAAAEGCACSEGCDLHFLEYVAFFCHGYSRGIQFGFNIWNAGRLAGAIRDVCPDDVVVPLYCCSTASAPRRLWGKGPGGDGGFADKLRDELCEAGATYCVVDAHTTVGHTTRNPSVRRFCGSGSRVGGVGGQWLVPRGSRRSRARVRWKKWRDLLWEKDGKNTLRFDFPFVGAHVLIEGLDEGCTVGPVQSSGSASSSTA